jgi:hypothetical protein
MKVISLLQPWATLVVMGAKKIETRSWNTKYRGEILIHASAGKKKIGRDAAELASKLGIKKPAFDDLPFGAIIGKVDLSDTAPTWQISDYLQNYHSPLTRFREWNIDDWEKEIPFGDYALNRYGWLLKNAIQFAKPIPCKGSLSIWNFEDVFQQIPAL